MLHSVLSLLFSLNELYFEGPKFRMVDSFGKAKLILLENIVDGTLEAPVKGDGFSIHGVLAFG